jgi:hypothetical protein
VRGASFDKKEFKRNVAGSGAYAPSSTVERVRFYAEPQHKRLRFLPKSAPPLPFNIHVPSSRNVLLFCTPSAFLLFSLTILAHLCLPVFRIMYFVM